MRMSEAGRWRRSHAPPRSPPRNLVTDTVPDIDSQPAGTASLPPFPDDAADDAVHNRQPPTLLHGGDVESSPAADVEEDSPAAEVFGGLGIDLEEDSPTDTLDDVLGNSPEVFAGVFGVIESGVEGNSLIESGVEGNTLDDRQVLLRRLDAFVGDATVLVSVSVYSRGGGYRNRAEPTRSG
jgi:hypothetical protein